MPNLENFASKATNISTIHFRIYSESICLYLVLNSKEFWIDYQKNHEGCLVKQSDKNQVRQENEEFISVACKDLENILNRQNGKILEELAIVILYGNDEERNTRSSDSEIFENLEYILQARKWILKVESLTTTVVSQEQVLKVLPYVCPESLRRLTINNAKEPDYTKCEEIMDMKEITKLEQFKKLEELATNGFSIEPKLIEYAVHFKEAQIGIREVTFEIFKEIREKLRGSSNFQYLQLRFSENNAEQPFVDLYGPPSQEVDQLGHKRRQWYFSTENESLVESIIFFLNNVLISRMNAKLVPDDANVL